MTSINDAIIKLDAKRPTFMRWIKIYMAELEKQDIITIIQSGFHKRIDIDLDRFVEFMENKGAKFSKYRKEA